VKKKAFKRQSDVSAGASGESESILNEKGEGKKKENA
jgi:hypothetical protein